MRFYIYLLFLLLLTSCETHLTEDFPEALVDASINFRFIGIDTSAGVPTGLEVGNLAPDFSHINHLGEVVSLDELLQENKVLLVFLQGNWNPHNLRLMCILSDSASYFKEAGIVPVIVTAMDQDWMYKIGKALNVDFPFMPDTSAQISALYQTRYRALPEYRRRMLIEENCQIPVNENGNSYLPLTSAFLINKEGIIEWSEVSIDPAFFPKVTHIYNILVINRETQYPKDFSENF